MDLVEERPRGYTSADDSRQFSMADFYELPDRDIFAKAKPFWQFVQDTLALRHNTYRRTIIGPNGHRVIIQDPYTGELREMIMMASNNYLGLTTHPRVVEAGRRAHERYGVGAGGVPLLAGTLDLHHALEARLAKFKSCEDAIVFSSGYSSNVGCISALIRKGDVALNDRLNHASLIDGCRFSGGELRTFKHNNMESLERVLAECDDKYLGKLVIVDGVFSMDGDITDLPRVVEVSRRHGARVMIDEAHATGVIGKNGRGTPEHFGMEGQVDIVAGTLSKALGGVGGFVCSNREVVNYIRFYARSYMFSTALPPAVTASLIEGINVIEEEPELRAQLWRNIRYVHDSLRRMGFDIGTTETAIVPVIVGDDPKLREMTRRIHEEGIFANPVYYPAVPKKVSRLRLSLMATHTQEDLDQTLSAVEKVGREFGVI
ncbi:MAG: aminotransferase class I/II-fold pyridoxal phosphate-dependent enzyme [Bacillota bacterium]|nr:aminotransferase class I/II-fold pyridoxal phosphate-dependent enzyme [Bacillota bacterium]